MGGSGSVAVQVKADTPVPPLFALIRHPLDHSLVISSRYINALSLFLAQEPIILLYHSTFRSTTGEKIYRSGERVVAGGVQRVSIRWLWLRPFQRIESQYHAPHACIGLMSLISLTDCPALSRIFVITPHFNARPVILPISHQSNAFQS